MIPKVIHYCWFGGNPLPPLALKCIESWKKYLPDYEIKEWNENNFDVNIIPYTKEAYQAKKYAFVSDYARFWILYHYGGLYFDTDVEVIKNMDDVIERGPFMGCEKDATEASVPNVAPGLGLGVYPGLSFYKEMLELYSTLNFRKVDGGLNLKTIVEYTTDILVKYGLQPQKEIQYVAEMWIYPVEYFCPIHVENNLKVMNITPRTLTIHHFAATWKPRSSEFLSKIKWWMASKIGGENLEKIIVMLGLRKIKNRK